MKKIIYPLLLSAVALLLDQSSKIAVLHAFATSPQPVEVTGFFNLVLVYNRGISFGLFQQNAQMGLWFLQMVTGGITLTLLVWLLRTPHALTRWAVALVIGGALGNILDRFLYGAVVDFLDFHAFGHHWPAFNVADSCVVTGAVLLLLQSLVFDTKNRQ